MSTSPGFDVQISNGLRNITYSDIPPLSLSFETANLVYPKTRTYISYWLETAYKA